MTTTAELLDIVAESLGREPNSVTLDDSPETIEEWDSVGHLSIIAALDSDLKVDISDEDVQGFTSIRELVDALKSRSIVQES